MVDGEHTLSGQVAQLLVGVVSGAEQGVVTTHRQLMEEANARSMVQGTLKHKVATPIHVQVLTCLSMSQISIDLVVHHCYFYSS